MQLAKDIFEMIFPQITTRWSKASKDAEKKWEDMRYNMKIDKDDEQPEMDN